ncbi:MAG: hypothetical protein ACTHKJ_09075, partial [Candidatus Nitrosocosmicus sp.]
KDEVGIESNLKEICKTLVKTNERDWKNNAFVKIYECITDKKPKLNPLEIQEIYFLPFSIVSEYLDKYPRLFVPGFRIVYSSYTKKTGS